MMQTEALILLMAAEKSPIPGDLIFMTSKLRRCGFLSRYSDRLTKKGKAVVDSMLRAGEETTLPVLLEMSIRRKRASGKGKRPNRPSHK